VLPGRADAVVNFRLLPGDTISSVEAHVKRVVGDDRVKVERAGGNPNEASAVAPVGSKPYGEIERTVREVFPTAVVAPGLMLGGTDGRHFQGVTDTVIRFTPIRADAERLKLFHGTNERIVIDHLAEMIRFYRRLLDNSLS
jgi:carboxypeptidase PM20D1